MLKETPLILGDTWFVPCLSCGQCNEENERYCTGCDEQMVTDKKLTSPEGP